MKTFEYNPAELEGVLFCFYIQSNRSGIRNICLVYGILEFLLSAGYPKYYSIKNSFKLVSKLFCSRSSTPISLLSRLHLVSYIMFWTFFGRIMYPTKQRQISWITEIRKINYFPCFIPIVRSGSGRGWPFAPSPQRSRMAADERALKSKLLKSYCVRPCYCCCATRLIRCGIMKQRNGEISLPKPLLALK